MDKPQPRFKDIEIGGRKFRVNKFDARTGSYMIIKILGILAPIFSEIGPAKLRAAKSIDDIDIDFGKVVSGLTELSEEDFDYIQSKCLGVCFENLPGGLTQVLRDEGSYGVIGLEDDTATVMALTVHALIFNVTSFFSAAPSILSLGGIANMFPPGAQTSMNMSTPQ